MPSGQLSGSTDTISAVASSSNSDGTLLDNKGAGLDDEHELSRTVPTCEACRQSKIRCGKEKPQCNRCIATGRTCIYRQRKVRTKKPGMHANFKEATAQILVDSGNACPEPEFQSARERVKPRTMVFTSFLGCSSENSVVEDEIEPPKEKIISTSGIPEIDEKKLIVSQRKKKVYKQYVTKHHRLYEPYMMTQAEDILAVSHKETPGFNSFSLSEPLSVWQTHFSNLNAKLELGWSVASLLLQSSLRTCINFFRIDVMSHIYVSREYLRFSQLNERIEDLVEEEMGESIDDFVTYIKTKVAKKSIKPIAVLNKHFIAFSKFHNPNNNPSQLMDILGVVDPPDGLNDTPLFRMKLDSRGILNGSLNSSISCRANKAFEKVFGFTDMEVLRCLESGITGFLPFGCSVISLLVADQRDFFSYMDSYSVKIANSTLTHVPPWYMEVPEILNMKLFVRDPSDTNIKHKKEFRVTALLRGLRDFNALFEEMYFRFEPLEDISDLLFETVAEEWLLQKKPRILPEFEEDFDLLEDILEDLENLPETRVESPEIAEGDFRLWEELNQPQPFAVRKE